MKKELKFIEEMSSYFIFRLSFAFKDYYMHDYIVYKHLFFTELPFIVISN